DRESAWAIYDDQGRPLCYDGIVEEVAVGKRAEQTALAAAPAAQDSRGMPSNQGSASSSEHQLPVIEKAVERLKARDSLQTTGGQSAIGGSMELREYWKIIRKRLWLILLLMVIGGTSAAYYT